MYLNISFLNLFKSKRKWDKLFGFYKKLSKNKYFEFEGFYDNYYYFKLELSLTYKRDHAGLSLNVNLFCYDITMSLHDCRHWDYPNNCWEENPSNLDGF